MASRWWVTERPCARQKAANCSVCGFFFTAPRGRGPVRGAPPRRARRGAPLRAQDLLHLELERQPVLEDEADERPDADAAQLLGLDHLAAEVVAQPFVDGQRPDVLGLQGLHHFSSTGDLKDSPWYAAFKMRTGWYARRPVFCRNCSAASGQSLETTSGSAAVTLAAAF